ncbi:MAG: hypothetical protein KatS3mg002_0127 [Candidatus Woesearchaeota archaeon]|nr:MAG: hypothetical protein KatS3mg002_0127 [Candidatus Woesearchaeota archaeon]
MKSKTIDVLFVEDKPKQVAAVKQIKNELEKKYGISIDFAETYVDYESKTKDKNYDIVMTDLFIPYSDGSESSSKGLELYKNLFDEIKTGIRRRDGSIQQALSDESDSMSGMRELYNSDKKKKNTLDVKSFETMRASGTLGNYVDGDSIEIALYKYDAYNIERDEKLMAAIIKPKKLKKEKSLHETIYRLIKSGDSEVLSKLPVPGATAPFGVKIFLKEYFEKDRVVKMVTDDHAHGTQGSPFMMYLQHKGLAEYGRMPFVNLDGFDLRLTTDAEKPQSPEGIEEIVVEALFMHKLKGISDEQFIAANVAKNYLNKLGFSVKDIYSGKQDISEQALKKHILERLQKDYDRIKAKYPDKDWHIEYLKQKNDLEAGKISIYNFSEGSFTEKKYLIADKIKDIKKGLEIIKEKIYK